MKIFKITGILLLALVITAGTTGISLFVHACGKGKHVDYALYPEFFSVGKSCCNPWDGKSMDKSCSTEGHQHGAGIEKSACCQSLHVILKVQEITKPVQKTNLPSYNLPVFISAQAVSLPEETEAESVFCLFRDESPPVLSGQELVIALHQIRIPS